MTTGLVAVPGIAGEVAKGRPNHGEARPEVLNVSMTPAASLMPAEPTHTGDTTGGGRDGKGPGKHVCHDVCPRAVVHRQDQEACARPGLEGSVVWHLSANLYSTRPTVYSTAGDAPRHTTTRAV